MDIERVLFYYMKQAPIAAKIIKEVQRCGDTFLFGGCLRACNDEEKYFSPRDIDIVVDVRDNEHYLQALLLPYSPKINRFGGYKIEPQSFSINDKYYNQIKSNRSIVSMDIWPLKKTWAFANNLLPYSESEYGEHLQDTVFLNIDSIAYNLTKGILYSEKYDEAMSTRILDVIIEENPQLNLNLLRALIFKKQYNMVFSKRLNDIFYKHISDMQNSQLLENLMKMQKARYQTNILSGNSLNQELLSICRTAQL